MTARDIYTVEPFANEIMEMTMTGEAIKDVIEYSYTRRDNIDLQTSGLEYTILTNSSGSYTDAKLTVDGEPLDPEATYSVAVPDYIGTGGSGYEFAGTVEQEGAGYMTNAMLMYANTLMNTEGAIDYESEGRISIDIEAEAEPGGEEIGNTANGLYSENKTEMDAGLGNLYTDALRSEAEADFAILNNSSVTGEIPPEVITDEQLEGLDQFENTVVVVETTGEQVKEVILEQSNYHGSVDLQVSGLHVQLIEAESGEERFSDVIVTLEDGTELQNNESYLAAYNDYMHGTSFYSLSEHIVTDEIGLVWETVVTFIEAQEEPIDYEEGLRIALNDEAEEEEKVMQTCIINKVHELIPSPPNNEIGYNRGQLTSMLVHYKNGKNVDLPEELSPAKECIDTAK
nr:5'-nucleotidase [Thalassobacillus sp. C254]